MTARGSGTRVSLYLPRFVPQPVERTPPIRVGEPAEVVERTSPPAARFWWWTTKAILDVVQRFLELAGHRVRWRYQRSGCDRPRRLERLVSTW
ncbi:MAG: hypothetical protein U0736_22960 [Gemmataceae bacterium]